MSNSYGLQGRCPITMPFDGVPLRCLRPAAHDGDHEWQIPRIVSRGDEHQTPEDVRANIDFGGTATAEREPGCLGSRPGSAPVGVAITRVQRRFHNEVVAQREAWGEGAPDERDIGGWLAGVSFDEWFALVRKVQADEEGICVAIHHLDHGQVDLARAELLACLPRRTQVEYHEKREERGGS